MTPAEMRGYRPGTVFLCQNNQYAISVPVAEEVAGQVADFLVRGELRNAVNYPSVTPEQMRALDPHMTIAGRLGAFASQAAAARRSSSGIDTS